MNMIKSVDLNTLVAPIRYPIVWRRYGTPNYGGSFKRAYYHFKTEAENVCQCAMKLMGIDRFHRKGSVYMLFTPE